MEKKTNKKWTIKMNYLAMIKADTERIVSLKKLKKECLMDHAYNWAEECKKRIEETILFMNETKSSLKKMLKRKRLFVDRKIQSKK